MSTGHLIHSGKFQNMPQKTNYILSFCTVTNRDGGIAIIEINNGAEIDVEMSEEIIQLADDVLGDKPLALLSNK